MIEVILKAIKQIRQNNYTVSSENIICLDSKDRAKIKIIESKK